MQTNQSLHRTGEPHLDACAAPVKQSMRGVPARHAAASLPCPALPARPFQGSWSRQLPSTRRHARSSTLSGFSLRRAARRDAQISNAIHIAANIPRHKRQPVAGRHSRTRPRLLLPTAASRPGPPRTGKPPTARRLRAPPPRSALPRSPPAALRPSRPRFALTFPRSSEAAAPLSNGFGCGTASAGRQFPRRGALRDAPELLQPPGAHGHPPAGAPRRGSFLTSPASAARAHAPFRR